MSMGIETLQPFALPARSHLKETEVKEMVEALLGGSDGS